MAETQHFGGIYKISQLQNVKIMSLPVSLIVWQDYHWISLFITTTDLEVMDSSGLINTQNYSNNLLQFLKVQLRGKNLSITPKLQSDKSNACALYAILFLIYRIATGKSLCDFCKLFTNNPIRNCNIIKDISRTIWPDNEKLLTLDNC